MVVLELFLGVEKHMLAKVVLEEEMVEKVEM
jgi:hypothetical protein